VEDDAAGDCSPLAAPSAGGVARTVTGVVSAASAVALCLAGLGLATVAELGLLRGRLGVAAESATGAEALPGLLLATLSILETGGAASGVGTAAAGGVLE
jgi:hypothetical protein